MENEEINILEIIFEAREDELSITNEQDKKVMNYEKTNRIKKHDYLNKELDKIPYNLKWLKENIKERLEDYIETVDYESYYFHKKYYFAGLKDGIKLNEELK